MDMSIEARVPRVLISVNSAICAAAYSYQYHMRATYKIVPIEQAVSVSRAPHQAAHETERT